MQAVCMRNFFGCSSFTHTVRLNEAYKQVVGMNVNAQLNPEKDFFKSKWAASSMPPNARLV